MVMLGNTDVRLGCQGWSESDWLGSFFPTNLKTADRLASYAATFDFVEIDSTFYSIPSPSTVLKWYDATPEDFRFAAKVPQVITHDPDSKTRFPRHPLGGDGWQAYLERFSETMRLLAGKLAALVVQLPPQWHWRQERLVVLESFLQALPTDLHWAVEFRHRDWLNRDTLALLKAYGVALVIQDLYYMPRHVEVTTADLAYIRLQGKRKEIVRMNEIQIGRYDASDFWAKTVLDLVQQNVQRVIVAANNHCQGFSPGTVASLQRRLGLPVSVPPVRVQGQLPLT